MDPIARIGQLLPKKKELFAQYELLTSQMLACPAEEMALLADKRQRLCGQIDQVDREIRDLTAELPDGPSALRALRLECPRGQVPEAYLGFFDGAQEIFAIANRVRLTEPEIAGRIEAELADLIEKIKANNRSVTAQAAKFGSGIPDGGGAQMLGSKYSKV